MTIFSIVEIVLALLGVFVIFCRNELRWAGRVLRGGNVAFVGMLLLAPLPIAVAIAFYSGGAMDLMRHAQGKSFEAIYAEAVAKLWWVDAAGIAASVVLIGLVFLIGGTADDRPAWDNRLARDGWRDPPLSVGQPAAPATDLPPKNG
jgi:heme/copper-type cytochrome/quinol oxidase subunit 2